MHYFLLFFFFALKQHVLFSTCEIKHFSWCFRGTVSKFTANKTFQYKPMQKVRQAGGIMEAHDNTDGFDVSRTDTSARFLSSVYCKKL